MQKPFVSLIVFYSVILSQTTVNPDISILGDLLVETDGNNTTLSNSGIELALQGYVNPFARADVFVHKHDDHASVEIEEAFLSIERGLPFNLGLRTGKFRPDFSRINKEHFHTYYYILPSKPVQGILGEEMWSSTGLEMNLLTPLPWYSNLSIGYFQNGISPHHEHGHSIEEKDNFTHEEESESGSAYTIRFSIFFDFTPVLHLEAGTGHYREITGEGDGIMAADFKLKWRPDAYRSFIWQGEFFSKSVKAIYTWINYQFNRVWNMGVLLDYSSRLESEEYKSIGLFFGFSPVEESSVLRIRIHQEYHGYEAPRFSIVAQAIWSLGPHKPHRY